MKKYYLVASFFLAMVLVLPLVGNAANSTFSSFTLDNIVQGDTLYKGVSSVRFSWEGSTLSGSQADILMCPQSLSGQLINGAVLGRCFYLAKNFSASDKHRTLTIPETTPTGQSLRDVRIQFVLRDTHSTNCSDAEGCLRIFYNSCGAGRSCLISGFLNLATANDSARISSISIPQVIKADQVIPSAVVQAINKGNTIWKDLGYDNENNYTIGVYASLGVGSTPAQNSNLFGAHRFSMSPVSVSPNETGTFVPVGHFKTPATPGIYRLSFQMVREHVRWFGDQSIVKDVMVIPNSVTGITIGTGNTWYRTENKTISWSTANFHSNTKYDAYLCFEPNTSSVCHLMTANVVTGSLSNAKVPAAYPSALSTGYIKILAKNLGTGISGDTVAGFSGRISILAEPLVDKAEIVTVSAIPAVMKVGETSPSARVIAKNTGNTTWTNLPAYTDNDYSIGVLGSVGVGSTPTAETNAFGRIRFDMIETSVLPNRNGNFSPATTFTAPATPGVYRLRFQMVKEGVAWFGAKSDIKTITVVPKKITGISASQNDWNLGEPNTVRWIATNFPAGTKYSVDLCTGTYTNNPSDPDTLLGSGCQNLKTDISSDFTVINAIPTSYTNSAGYFRVNAIVPGLSGTVSGVSSTRIKLKVKVDPKIFPAYFGFCGAACGETVPDTGANPWLAGTSKTIKFNCKDIPADKYYKVFFTVSDAIVPESKATISAGSLCSSGTKTVYLKVAPPSFFSSSNSSDNGFFRVKLVVTNDLAGNQNFVVGTSTLRSDSSPFRMKAQGTVGLSNLRVE